MHAFFTLFLKTMTLTEKLLTGSLVVALLIAIVPASDAFQRFGNENLNRPSIEEMQEIQESITRTVENIENGVQITITSDDEDVVTHLQEERNPRGPRNEDVVHTVENIENGIILTITSDDEALVEHIQEMAELRENGSPHRGMKGGNHGGRRGQGGMNNGDCPYAIQ